jgi:hypothetical protein
MKRFYLFILAMMAFAACSPDTPTPEPQPQPEPEKSLFNISVQEDKLSAFSVTFDIVPEDKEAKYYYDIISKARISEIDINTLKDEIEAGSAKMAELTGTPYDEVLEQMLSKGDQLSVLSNAGYRPETDFYIYAFYWDATSNDELVLCEFSTPAMKESKESIEIVTTAIDTHSINVELTPSSGVTEYWYYFAERTKVEAMFKALEDDNAFMSYHAMNVGSRMEGQQAMEHKGLKPETEYMAVVMGIDSELNRFQLSEVFATCSEQTQQRVESELFEKLLGEWTGTQTITDLYAEPMENTFSVNILQNVDDVSYDYRAMNQLVATVDGWCNIDYYSTTELVEMEIEDAEEKWGPKWIFNIAEGDVVTMDGMARNSVVGWLFFGNCFMLNMDADSSVVSTNADFEVEVSADYNTITIKSPASMPNNYPGLGYYFDSFGWMGYYYGVSNIVLTRK